MEGKKNMAYGKAIELFLVNGTADSLVTAELSNWNGVKIKKNCLMEAFSVYVLSQYIHVWRRLCNRESDEKEIC